MPRTSADMVRSALEADASEYSDAALEFEISQANQLVDDKVAPYAGPGDADALVSVETYLAAWLAVDDTDAGSAPVSNLSQSSRSVSFDTSDLTGTAAEMFQRAVIFDPTGRVETLGEPSATMQVPDVMGTE